MIRDLGPLGLRATVGSYLAVHGAQKLWGSFDGPASTQPRPGSSAWACRPAGRWQPWPARPSSTGGVLTATGIAHPLGPIAIASTMAVAAASHRDGGTLGGQGRL